MSVNEGSIRAQLELDLSNLQTQVDAALGHFKRLEQGAKAIPAVAPKIDGATIEREAVQATSALTNLGAALGVQLAGAGGQAARVLETATEGVVNLERAAGAAGVGLVALAATGAVALLKMGQAYEAGFRQIAARTGETGEVLKGMQESLETLGERSPIAIDKISNVLITVHQRTGETGEALEQTTASMLKYARATGTDATESTANLARVFNAFKVPVEEQRGTLDAFVTVQQRTGISAQELQQQLQATGPVLRAYGLSAKESAAFLGILDQAGINSQQVVFGLRRALGDIGGPDAKKQLFALIEDLGAMDDQTLATQRATELFGARSAAALLDLARSGKLSLENIDETLAGSTGATEAAADATKSAFDRIEIAIKKAERAWTPTAVAMAEAMSQFAIDTLAALDNVGKAIDEFLASDQVRKLASVAIILGRGIGNLATGTVPEPTVTPTPEQAEGAFLVGGQAAGVAAVAGLSEEERKLVQEHQARIAAEEQLVALDAALQAANAPLETSTEALADAEEAVAEATTKTTAATVDSAAATLRILEGYLKAKDGAVDYTKAIAAAGTGHAGFIESTLNEQRTAELLDSSLKKLTDTHVKAAAITLQHAALQTEGAERAHLLAQAQALVTASLGPQQQLTERLDALATAVLPNLDARTAQYVKQLKEAGDTTGLATTLSQALGVSQDELAAKLGGTGAQAAEYAKQQGAASKALGEYVSDENKSRIGSVLGELAKATDSVTAAQAKQLEQSGQTNEALTLLLQHAGASPGAIAGLAHSLEEGGAAAFDAQEKIRALVTYVRDQSGQVRLKVDVDIEKTQQAIGDLQANYREGQGQRADAETKATQAYVEQGVALNRQQDKNAETHLSNITDINKARTDSTRQLGEDIGKATSTANEASTKLDEKIDDAIAKHALAVANAQDKYRDTVANAVDTYSKGIESLADRAHGIMQQAADAAASALHTVSGAMQSYNDQARQTANATSIQQENARLQSYGFTDFQSQQSALRAAQIQAEGTAGLAQVAGANQLNQTLQGSNQALQKATEKAGQEMDKVAAETAKLTAAYQKTVDKAGNDFEQAVRNADLAEEKTIQDANEQLKQVNQHLSESLAHAKAEDEKRQRDLREREDKENQRYFEEQQRIAEQRAKQDAEFEGAEKSRRDAQRKADDAYLKQLRQLDAQLDSLKALKSLPGDTAEAIAARVKIGEQQFLAGATITNLETQVDFLSESIGEFARQSRGR